METIHLYCKYLDKVNCCRSPFNFSEKQNISTEFCKQMGIDCYSLSFLPIVRSERILTLFTQMMEVYKKAEPLRIARLNNLLLEILIEISGMGAFSKKPVPGEQKGLRAVKKTGIQKIHRANHL